MTDTLGQESLVKPRVRTEPWVMVNNLKPGSQTHSVDEHTSLHAILFLVFMSWAKYTFPKAPRGTKPEPMFL